MAFTFLKTKKKTGELVRDSNGNPIKVTLLNPSEKGQKFARELREGRKRRNDGSFYIDKTGHTVKLSDNQRAYRSGYLDAQKDSVKAYKARKLKKHAK